MAELRLTADEGLVDLDHSRQLSDNALPIVHHLADRMANLSRGLLVHAQNARHYDRRDALGGGQHKEHRGDPGPEIQLRCVEGRPRSDSELAPAFSLDALTRVVPVV